VLKKAPLATISNWIVVDVPESTTPYGFSLHLRVNISPGDFGRELVMVAWLRPEVGTGESLKGHTRLLWFRGEDVVGSISGVPRALSESDKSDLYLVTKAGIPEGVTSVEVFEKKFANFRSLLTLCCVDGTAPWRTGKSSSS
jgi:hypothetical protein